MVRRRTPLPNENSTSLQPVLAEIKKLRAAYRSASLESTTECDKQLNKVVALLALASVEQALDSLLANKQPGMAGALTATHVLNDLVRREALLGPSFGYSEREVKRYVRWALDPARKASQQAHITSAAELAACLEAVHERVTSRTASTGGGWLSRKRAVRRIRIEAQDGLFFIGAIIADGLSRPLFPLSYAIGTSGLANSRADG